MRVPVRTGKKRRPDADSSASSGTANAVSGVSGLIGAFGITNAPTTVCKRQQAHGTRRAVRVCRWHTMCCRINRESSSPSINGQSACSMYSKCICTRLLCAQHVAGLALSQHHLEEVRRHRHEVWHLQHPLARQSTPAEDVVQPAQAGCLVWYALQSGRCMSDCG